MSREIKFRGINTSGKFVYGSLVNNCVGLNNMPKTNTRTWIVESAFGNGEWFHILRRQYVKPETVGQYTGLKDKNGVEIYEGDIIYHPKQGKAEVFYPFRDMNASFGARRLQSPRYNNMLQDMQIWEVIGNIYENPELLQ